MKVALNTVDLFPGRERLMPFRTILEVAQVMRQHGVETNILNSSMATINSEDYEWHGVPIKQVPRNFTALSQYVNQQHYDVFFFPSTFRDGLKNLTGLKLIECKKWAYIPSGVNPRSNAWKLFQKYGYNLSHAYLFEAFTPKWILAKKLKQTGFTGVIGLTDYTSKLLSKHINTSTILPGKDNFEYITSDSTIIKAEGLKDKKFYLFTGAPHLVRGSELLLDAFDKFAAMNTDAYIIFLMRTDVGSTYQSFMNKVSQLKYKECVKILKAPLSIPQLKAFVEAAYAVVLPFVCIPAEIPITYFEVLSVGTPIVTFSNGGTTEYLADGLKTVNGIVSSKMAKALDSLWNNKYERNLLSEKAQKLMHNHPTWNEVGKRWINILSE